jgi:shikimate dehydrogenase
MISLSLLGKEIAHSKSHELYEELLNKKIQYTKYDKETTSDIPPLDVIFENSVGLSITSPYKKHFIEQVVIEKDIIDLNAINCIKKEADLYYGTNTDYLALNDIFSDYLNIYKKLDCLILGDGSMSHVTQILLRKMNIPFTVVSRKTEKNIRNYRLSDGKNEKQKIIINSCSRQFEFTGEFDSGIIFLDYNYNFIPHKNHFASLGDQYIDGMGLLKSQAEYALKFWKISK